MSWWKEVAFLLLVVLSLVARVGADCVAGFQEAGKHRAIQLVVPQEPRTWDQLDQLCHGEFSKQELVQLYSNITKELKKLCGETLLPVNVYKYYTNSPLAGRQEATDLYWLSLYDTQYPRLEGGAEVLNLTSGLWHLVERDHNFTCAVCQQKITKDIFREAFINEPNLVSPSKSFQITFVSREEHVGPSVISATEQERLVKIIEAELETVITYKYPTTTSLRKIFINSARRLVIIFHYNMQVFTCYLASDRDIIEAATSANYTKTLEDYEMQVEYIKQCPEEVTFGLDEKPITWPKTWAGKVQTVLDESTGVYLRRECAYNETEYRHFWTPPTYWEIVWEPCSLQDQYLSEIKYQEHLGTAIMSIHNNVLHQFTESPTNETTLQTIANIVSVDIREGSELHPVMARDLENVLLKYPMSNDSDIYVLSTLLVQLAVTDLKPAKLYDGVAFAYNLSYNCNYMCPKKPVILQFTSSSNSTVMIPNEKFAVQLSAEFTLASSRLAFAVVWKTAVRIEKMIYSSLQNPRFPIIHIVLSLNPKNARGLSLDDDHFYVEIAYEPSFHVRPVSCAAWNNALNNWTTNGCRQLKAERGNRTVCRCRGKYFVQEGSMLAAKYTLQEHYGIPGYWWTSVFKDYTGPGISMAIEVLFSGLGLLSIILTTILFKKWRDNPGNKILLHMVMALTCNLVLGFITTLAQFDTESVSCLLIGVFRHYSYLAMFLWMLVLSGLQLKRLTTVVGAKTTSHLILKLALISWGVPLLPIAVLLAWNTRFYRSDRFDRGYCYPEGLVFKLTVQAPAGVVLVVNFFVFIKILTHIFECHGKKITKHSKNDKAEKLNKLKTSLFIFFLFGFTWIFHFLSEVRVINSDFLFEYLFLMTATFHLMMLALFFIFLQDSTRGLWLSYLGKGKSKILSRKVFIRKNKTRSVDS